MLQSVTWSATLTLGSAMGGMALPTCFGAEAALVIDSVTFLVSAVLVCASTRCTDETSIARQEKTYRLGRLHRRGALYLPTV